jgi:hypothetical protein
LFEPFEKKEQVSGIVKADIENLIIIYEEKFGQGQLFKTKATVPFCR